MGTQYQKQTGPVLYNEPFRGKTGIPVGKEIETEAITEKIQSIQSIQSRLEIAKKTKTSFTFQEFAVAISTKTNEEKLKDAFDVYDMDKDGTISKAELIHTLRVMGEEITEDYAEIVLSKIDKDKDGKINFEEFKSFFNLKVAESKV